MHTRGSPSVLRTVTTPIKNFLSRAKTSLSSFLPSLPYSVCKSLNCQGNSVCKSLNCLAMLPCRTSLNCQDTSGCMTINCPPHCTAQSCVQSYDRPCDCPTIRMDGTIGPSLQNPCPDLDLSSSTDSLQTHDSLVTPESPHLPSPAESLVEGPTDATHVAEDTEGSYTSQDHDTQVQTNDSLAYDSLVTALSRLSLEPDPDPLLDHLDRSMTHLDGTYT